MKHIRLTNDPRKEGSPHFYQAEDPSKLLVQGWHVADPGFVPPADEAVVEVPAALVVEAVCRLAGEVTRTDLVRMLRFFSRSAFRLETLLVYRDDDEQPLFDHWRATGEIVVDTADEEWQRMIAGHLTAGRTMRRVHLVRQPLTDYLRWEFGSQLEFGEDIRVVDLAEHPELADHPGDYWLFDDRIGVAMRYDADGRLLRCEPIGDSDIDRCRDWRDLTWQAGTPLGDFLRRAEAA
ncbi:MAG: DUF6879 family protein [Egibacteraceae bacterium]